MTEDRMKRRAFASALLRSACLGFALLFAAGLPAEDEARSKEGERLYNGIVLPAPWPPRLTSISREPQTPTYLSAPPAIIPIDVGRQLFVDDFLVAETTLQRTFHRAEYHPASPVLKPDRPWEEQNSPMAMPYSDGVGY